MMNAIFSNFFDSDGCLFLDSNDPLVSSFHEQILNLSLCGSAGFLMQVCRTFGQNLMWVDLYYYDCILKEPGHNLEALWSMIMSLELTSLRLTSINGVECMTLYDPNRPNGVSLQIVRLSTRDYKYKLVMSE